MDMFYVYVLKSESSNKLYVGVTENLEDRLRQHLSRGYTIFTKRYPDWSLIYKEEFNTRAIAMKREKFLKSGDGRKVLKLKGIIH